MRMLALPAALALALLLYLPLPLLAEKLPAALRALYARVLRLFTRRDGRADAPLALCAFLLLLGGAATLLGALHPLAAAAVIAPLFHGLAALPLAAADKETLDGGALSGDIPAYEARVRARCASLAPAFTLGLCAPMLLTAVGMPLYIGGALGWINAGLRAAGADLPAARRIVSAVDRIADGVFRALLLLCSGAVGRSPLRVAGKTAQEKLMSALGVDDRDPAAHPPVAGDIAQGVFLCCLCGAVLCLTLTLAGMAVC